MDVTKTPQTHIIRPTKLCLEHNCFNEAFQNSPIGTNAKHFLIRNNNFPWKIYFFFLVQKDKSVLQLIIKQLYLAWCNIQTFNLFGHKNSDLHFSTYVNWNECKNVYSFPDNGLVFVIQGTECYFCYA